MRPEVGQVISGKYRLTRLIGEGGMGSVFEATHEYLGSAVALKFLNPGLAQRHGLVARFLQEARVSASIRSVHVVQVSDVDQTTEGLPYLVMELLEGENLQQCLNRTQKLPLGRALEYGAQILNGLEAAHARGIVHRDLKPDNVFIVQTGQGPLLKLLDFGIAKLRSIAEAQPGLTRPGALMGTPEYMAPEQAFSADTADHRADIFAAGVILFEMIAGSRPVQVDDPQAMAALVMAGQVSRLVDVVPEVPLALSEVVRRALSGRPDDRFSSAAEMRGAIFPFFTASSQATGLANYPSMVAATPPMPPARAATAVVSAPAAGDRPAPTQPGTDPDGYGSPPATLPPEQALEGRTGTVVGGGMGFEGPGATSMGGDYGPGDYGPGDYGPGDYGPTTEMAPIPYGAGSGPVVPPRPQKKASGAWTLLGVIAGLLGVLAAAALIAFFVISNGESDQTEPFPTITPPEVVTAETTGASIPTETTPPTATPPPTVTSPPTVQPPRKDAGPDVGLGFPGLPDGGLSLPPFPSSIPPITMPSELPPFPIPGWPPPNQ